MTSSKLFTGLALTLAAFALTFAITVTAIADDAAPSPARSKEDARAEAQSTGLLSKLLFLKKLRIFKDGTAKFSYSSTVPVQSATEHGIDNLDVSVETWLSATYPYCWEGGRCDTDDYEDEELVKRRKEIAERLKNKTRILFVPVETRVRIKLDGENRGLDIRDVRAGLIRFVIGHNTGLTFQILSYVMKKHEFDFGTQKKVEIVSATFSDKEPLTDSLEFVVKAHVFGALGTFQSNRAAIKKGYADYSTDELNEWPENFGGTGSVGLRIKKSVLFEVFGGADFDLSVENGTDASRHNGEAQKPGPYSKTATFGQKKVGAAMRIQASDTFAAHLTWERNFYKQSLDIFDRDLREEDRNGDGIAGWYYYGDLAGPGRVAKDSLDTDTVMMTLEKHW